MLSLEEIGPVVLEKIFKVIFLLFPNYLTFWEGHGPSFEQTQISFTQRYFVPSLVEINPVVLEKKIFKAVKLFILFPNYLPFERGASLIWTNLNALHPGILLPFWLKMAHWFRRRRWNYEKFTDGRTERQTTDDRWSEKLTWALSLGELKQEIE